MNVDDFVYLTLMSENEKIPPVAHTKGETLRFLEGSLDGWTVWYL